MKKLLLRIFCTNALCMTWLSGCQNEPSESVDQDKIFANYELFYDKNVNKTYAKATFRFGNGLGTLLQLSSPSEVKFNNDALNFQAAGSYYEKVYDGFVSSGSFFFKNTKGTTYTNAVPTIKPVEFPVSNITISKAATYSLSWVGDPLGAKENVGVLIGSQTFLQVNPGTMAINLSNSQLQLLTNGPYTAVMDRSFTSEPVQQTPAGGLLTGKYRAANKSVQITD